MSPSLFSYSWFLSCGLHYNGETSQPARKPSAESGAGPVSVLLCRRDSPAAFLCVYFGFSDPHHFCADSCQITQRCASPSCQSLACPFSSSVRYLLALSLSPGELRVS